MAQKDKAEFFSGFPGEDDGNAVKAKRRRPISPDNNAEKSMSSDENEKWDELALEDQVVGKLQEWLAMPISKETSFAVSSSQDGLLFVRQQVNKEKKSIYAPLQRAHPHVQLC